MTSRPLHKGMGEAVARRTILRGSETWDQVSRRVAFGNTLLDPRGLVDYEGLQQHITNGSVLMSGRHLQHGDHLQPERNMEVFTNCATAATSSMLFYLLLNGSGVGRAYDDALMLVDWSFMPDIKVVLSQDHPDFTGVIGVESAEEARAKYPDAEWHEVGDSREGWTKSVALVETLTYQKVHRDKTVVLDFSPVRGKGSKIKGMQDRPASGPGPLMEALRNVARVKYLGFRPWKATMFVDHYLAECVLVGGARRAARIATKYWKDSDILEFVNIKKDAGLWTANNSVAVTKEFWKQKSKKAQKIFEAVSEASYTHGTGEPGWLNVDRLTAKDDDLEKIYGNGDFLDSPKYKLDDDEKSLYKELAKMVIEHPYHYIVNPCGEIVLFILGGYCVIADVVPYHAHDLDHAEEAFRQTTRALIRTNLMSSLYKAEVSRTNRIGVSMTGIHEFAWKFFGLGFRDLLDEEKSLPFWQTLSRFKRAVRDECEVYCPLLGVAVPHTDTTLKPAGSTSKLYGLTEAAHLASMRRFLRWVQFTNEDPLVARYQEMGYPTRKLEVYKGHTIVGFPTEPEITKLGMGDKLVTALEATPEEQFQWLMLLEKWWIRGVGEDGEPLEEYGNQVSYTLKYDPSVVTYDAYKEVVMEYMPNIRACAVQPLTDLSAYEYLPEEPVSDERFAEIVAGINDPDLIQEISLEELACSSGACPL